MKHLKLKKIYTYQPDNMQCLWLDFMHWPVCVASFASMLQSVSPLGSGSLMSAEEHVVQHSLFVYIGLRFLREPKEITNWNF